ncbi:DsrE family protein [Serpentinimonas barnesii]|uniref:DsrE family protein n=1 Tax=Serpentinimonas barnesii TaxID=1458427 RepID=UPI000495EB2B|nr:DsrE family protein [Serpentinimonas barnesii]
MNRNSLPWAAARFRLWTLLLLALGTALLAPQPAQASERQAKVVYHADFSDPRRFSSMLTSINFMVTHYTNEMIDFDVRIVFHSHGIRFLTDDPLTGTPFAQDAALAQQRENLRGRLLALHQVHRVKLELCEITRAQVNLDPSRLYAGVERVPSGVVRIAELQNEQGFAYIKIE